MDRELFTVAEAAVALEMQPGSVRDAIARGKMAAIRIGGSDKRAGMLFVHRDQIEAYRETYRERRGRYHRRRRGTDTISPET
jgi:hypothetical protein